MNKKTRTKETSNWSSMEQILSWKSKTQSNSSNFPGYNGNWSVITLFIISRHIEESCSRGNASVFRSVSTRIECKLEYRLFVGRICGFQFLQEYQ
jgi:hypothetical protein